MSSFNSLSPEDKGLLYGLLYRAGIWMSHSDDEEGELDDTKEMKALVDILKSFSENGDTEFLRDAVAHTLSNKDKWEIWENQSFDILADCQKAVTVLRSNCTKDDAQSYVKALKTTAECVACAYGEFGMAEEPDDNLWSHFMGRVKKKISGHDIQDDFGNISPAEQSALNRLEAALKIDD